MAAERVFVFGSNLQGVHGAGAALHAARWCGAERGQGEGPMGASFPPTCYAIPTKSSPHISLSLSDVANAVDRFKVYAAEHPDLQFQVTRIGCGLAGFTDDQIAPLFDDAPPNCQLPGVWWRRRYPDVYRIIVAGSRHIGTPSTLDMPSRGAAPNDAERVEVERKLVFKRLDSLTSNLRGNIEVVSGMAKGPDTLGVEWAARQHRHVAEFPADWKRHGKAAGPIRNALMSWHSTHLVAFWDGRSAGTGHMIETAKRDGLSVRVILVDQS